MARCIVRLYDEPELFVEWSTVVSAPVGPVMARSDLADESADRMARLDERGTTGLDEGEDADSTVLCNRAGPDESRIPTRQGIAAWMWKGGRHYTAAARSAVVAARLDRLWSKVEWGSVWDHDKGTPVVQRESSNGKEA